MFGKLKALFGRKADPEIIEELEELLVQADVGISCAEKLIKSLGKTVSAEKFKETALEILSINAPTTYAKPRVILIVGVNGSGKTTSCAKLAKRFQSEGKSVLLVAADTFRAAATEQLTMWAEKFGLDIAIGKQGADPSSVVHDALSENRDKDIILIDTAGRLQSKTDLMRELEKIGRVCNKVIPDSPHETLLVVDATLGQNSLDQARIFSQYVLLTGIILAKLDGTAKGGIALAIHHELNLPVQFIGTGEGASDLAPFDPQEYVNTLIPYS